MGVSKRQSPALESISSAIAAMLQQSTIAITAAVTPVAVTALVRAVTAIVTRGSFLRSNTRPSHRKPTGRAPYCSAGNRSQPFTLRLGSIAHLLRRRHIAPLPLHLWRQIRSWRILLPIPLLRDPSLSLSGIPYILDMSAMALVIAWMVTGLVMYVRIS